MYSSRQHYPSSYTIIHVCIYFNANFFIGYMSCMLPNMLTNPFTLSQSYSTNIFTSYCLYCIVYICFQQQRWVGQTGALCWFSSGQHFTQKGSKDIQISGLFDITPHVHFRGSTKGNSYTTVCGIALLIPTTTDLKMELKSYTLFSDCKKTQVEMCRGSRMVDQFSLFQIDIFNCIIPNCFNQLRVCNS